MTGQQRGSAGASNGNSVRLSRNSGKRMVAKCALSPFPDGNCFSTLAVDGTDCIWHAVILAEISRIEAKDARPDNVGFTRQNAAPRWLPGPWRPIQPLTMEARSRSSTKSARKRTGAMHLQVRSRLSNVKFRPSPAFRMVHVSPWGRDAAVEPQACGTQVQGQVSFNSQGPGEAIAGMVFMSDLVRRGEGGDTCGDDSMVRIWHVARPSRDQAGRVGIPAGGSLHIASIRRPRPGGHPDFASTETAEARGIEMEEPGCSDDIPGAHRKTEHGR